MPRDFRAKQIRTTQIIASGGVGASNSSVGLLIYSSSDATDLVGGMTHNMTASIGSDVWMFVSGANEGKNKKSGVVCFGGDVVVSGVFYAEKMVVEVTEATTGSLFVSGNLFVSGSGNIRGGLVVNDEGLAVGDFRAESDGEDEALFLDASANIFYVNKGETAFETVISNVTDEALRVDAEGVVINEDSHADIDFRVESGNVASAIAVDAGTDKIIIDGGAAAADALTLKSGHASGGIDIDAGTGGIAIDSTGVVSIDGADDMNFTITSGAGGEDLTIQQIGGNDSSIIITAAGTGTDAVKIDATAGDMLVGPTLADGKTLKLGKSGAVEVTIAPHGTAASEKYTVTNTAGTAIDAISLNASAGGILINADASKIHIDAEGTGTDAVNIDSAGGIDIDADGVVAIAGGGGGEFIVGGAGNDLTLSSEGGSLYITGSDNVGIQGEANSATAIVIKASHAGGGIDIDAGTGGIAVDANGAVSIDAVGPSNLTTKGILTASGSSGLNLKSDGGTIDIETRVGSIDIDSAGALTIDSATSIAIGANADKPIDIDSTTLDIDASGAVTIDSSAGSNFTVTGAGNDLTLSSEGGSLYITGSDNLGLQGELVGVVIKASHSTGKVDIEAGTGGVNVATSTSGTPITIGHTTSETRVNDNLTVLGNTEIRGFISASLGLSGSLTRLHDGKSYIEAGSGVTVSSASNGAITISSTAGGIDGSGAANRVTYWSDADTLTSNANFTFDGTDATLASTSKLEFRDSGLFINSRADGHLDISSDTRLTLTGSGAVADAVALQNSNAAGGIDIDAGSKGITIDTTGILYVTSSNNNANAIQMFASAGGLSFVAAGAAGEDIDIRNTNGSIQIVGGENQANAVRLHASNAAGGLDIDTGTGGVAIDTTGVISIDAVGTSNLTTKGALTLSGSLALNLASDIGEIDITTRQGNIDINATAGTVAIDGGGGINIGTAGHVAVDFNADTLDIDALLAVTIDSLGGTIGIGTNDNDFNISIGTQGGRVIALGSTDAGIDIDAGTGGIALDSTGVISLDAVGASNLTTNGALTVSGSTGLNLMSDGGTIDIETRVGAIDIDSASTLTIDSATSISIGTTADKPIDIDSTTLDIDASGNITIDASAGSISVGTNSSGRPINIGHTTSEARINDNLTVLGDAGFRGFVSASLGLSGSLTRLHDGKSYIEAGANIGVSSASNGAITISASGLVDGSGAATRLAYWSDSDSITSDSDLTFDGTTLTVNKSAIINEEGGNNDFRVETANKEYAIYTSGQFDKLLILSGGSPSSYNEAKGSDVNFYVSGSQDSQGTATAGTTVFGGDTYVSGTSYGNQYFYTWHSYNIGNSDPKYIPFKLNNEVTNATEDQQMIVPFPGRLMRVLIRTSNNSGLGATSISFHTGSAAGGVDYIETTKTETIAHVIPSGGTTAIFDFTSASQFAAGDIVGISIDPSNAANDVNITCVWKYQTYRIVSGTLG